MAGIRDRMLEFTGLSVVAMLAACSSVDAPDAPPDVPQPPDAASLGIIVSEALTPPSAAAGGAVASLARAGAADNVAYVSLPPGTFPSGETVTITNLASGVARTQPMVAGGFDPVPILSTAGDTLEIQIRGANEPIASSTGVVPTRRPPIVVRTGPAKNKTAVPLNVRVFVVFSEPIDAATITSETIKLLLNGQPVDGTVTLSADGLRAEFAPAETLARPRTYTLVITTGALDLAGDPLEQQVEVSFTTGTTLWALSYGGSAWDAANSVQLTSDGGFIVAGRTESFGRGSGDVWIIRTNGSGDTLWTRTYGGTRFDGFRPAVQQTFDGGFVVATSTESFGAGSWDVWLIRTDGSGGTLWTRTYGGTDLDQGQSVQQLSDGGFIVAGATYSFGADSGDVWLIRTDASGDTLWTRTYGGSRLDRGYSVQETTGGGFIVTGFTYSFGADDGDVWLIRTDASGDTLWTRTYDGGAGWDNGSSVRETSDGGFVIAGVTGLRSDSTGNVWLIRSDASGDTLWTRTFGGTGLDFAESVEQTSDGGFILAGATESPDLGSRDVWVIRTDDLGNALWARTYGGVDYEVGYSVRQTADGGFVVAGVTKSYGAGNGDVWLIRIAPE